MADLRRQLEASRRREAQARQDLQNLQRITGWIDPAYAAALCDAQELAMIAIRRPDDLGGQITTNGASSRPPSYVPRMYDALRKQRVWQRREATRIRQLIRHIVDQDTDPEDSAEIPRSVPNKIRRNHAASRLHPTVLDATVSVVEPRAPNGRPQRFDTQEAG